MTAWYLLDNFWSASSADWQ